MTPQLPLRPLVVTVLACALALWSSLAVTAETALQTRIEKIAATLDGQLGVFARNLTTGDTVALAADTRFPTASVIKVPVMVEAFHQIEAGALTLETPVRLRLDAKVGGSGTLREMHDGTEVTVRDLVHLMIVVSDNTATNLLLEKVGTLKVNARMESYGLRQTKIFRPTFRGGQPDCCPEQEREFGLGMSTPREMATLLERVATGRAVSEAASKEMFAILERQQDRNMIARRLPLGAEGLLIGNKTGTDEEKIADASGRLGHVRADVAIVRAPRATYVLAMFARRVNDESWTADNRALVCGAEIGRAIYDAWGARQGTTGQANHSPS
jgi:beta-lactamase class A